MKPETVPLLCRPGTCEPLRLVTEPGSDGTLREVLVAIDSGERFEIRDGIPLLLDKTKITGFNQQYQDFYNRIAGGYDTAMDMFATLVGGGKGRFRSEFLSELKMKEGDRVLEVSIGTGANLHYISMPVSFFGVDLSWGMLKKCRKNLKRWQLEAELILGNAEELPLLDELFDVVFHVGGINAFNDRARAISEMIRVAKPATRIIIVDETVDLLESLAWFPGVKKWLKEHRQRFSAPVELIPEGMRDIQVKEIARGNLYCLAFTKP